MTREDLTTLVGRRVRLTEPLDLYPETIVPGGNTGILARVEDDCVWIKLDKHFPELAEWDNEAQIWDWSDTETGFYFPIELIEGGE